MTRKILLLTSTYPFRPGEEFLEAELAQVAHVPEAEVLVMPYKGSGEQRPVPKGVTVDTRLAKTSAWWRRLPLYGLVLSKSTTYRELAEQRRMGKHSPGPALRTMLVAGHVYRVERAIRRVLREDPGVGVVYAYWHGPMAYAAARLRRKGIVGHLVVRAHRGDVFEDDSPYGYKPFHRCSIPFIDTIFAISYVAREYILDNYGPADVRVARLGVAAPAMPHDADSGDSEADRDSGLEGEGPGEFAVLSISQCVPVKRLPLLVGGLAEAARSRPGQKFVWTHLGGGPEYRSVAELAGELLGPLPNITYRLQGQLTNEGVAEHLSIEKYDLLINVSTVEGISVAAMEAMSYGIPVLATNVGASAELVKPETGWLLPATPTEAIVGRGILEALDDPKRRDAGRAARKLIEQEFSAARVYRDFYEQLLRRAK